MKRSNAADKLIAASIIAIGISSIVNQVITIREFLSLFYGNEITISAVIFCWLTIGAIGSLCARFFKRGSLSSFSFLLFLIAILPLAQILLIRILRSAFFPHGISLSFYNILAYVLFTTFPYCFAIGFALPYCQAVSKKEGEFFIDTGILYCLDSIGDITGGILASFVFVYFLKPFSIIGITSLITFFVLEILLWIRNKKLFFASLLFVGFFIWFVFSSPAEKYSLSLHYGNIVAYEESPYGRIVVTKEKDQYTVWESSTPFYSQKDIARAEEKVHYALCQLDSVKDVLLISGGLGATIREIEKYHPLHIDYVELDPSVTKIGLKLKLIPEAKNLSIINTDGRRYLRSTKKRYSAIIVDLPDPDTFQINRFFTKEFFMLAKSHLTREGLICVKMKYYPNYISKVRKRKISILYNTLKCCFRYVELIPGTELYFLAGDRPIYTDIPRRLNKLHIKTLYVVPYFYGNVTPDRIRLLKKAILSDTEINTDFKPCLVKVVFQEWFKKFNTSPFYLIFSLASLLFLYLVFIKREEYVLFSTGFSLMGLEMLCILLFQILYGYVYLKVGAIITAFLIGLFPGSLIGIKVRKSAKRYLLITELLILALLISCPLYLSITKNIPKILFLLYPFIFSLICGIQFPVLAQIIGEEKSPASRLFASDLIGASFGTVIIGIVAIPFFGLFSALLLIITLKITSLLITYKLFITAAC